MKLRYQALSALCILSVIALAGCGGEEDLSEEELPQVVVTAVTESVDVKDREVDGYDYTPLFTITEDGESVEVLSTYIDSTAVLETAGSYTVSCSYKDESAALTVNVSATVYALTLSVSEVTVRASQWDSYDYAALFTATMDGEPVEITEDMISSDVSSAPGDYSVTVTYAGESKTLTVHISDEHEIAAVAAYREIVLEESALASFDFTSLFYLYVDGTYVNVTREMIDASALEGVAAGESAEVLFSYSLGASKSEASVRVSVTADAQITVASKNVVTYPNSAAIDLTSLFEIKKGDEKIPVSSDMIEGSVDYAKAGENVITLRYGGESYTAVVEVKMGVVLGYAASDVVTVRKGTSQTSYDFAGDFLVLINGIAFNDMLDSYLDTSEVDFSTAGSYTATLTVKYNENTYSALSGPVFTEVSETITYVVVENTYSIRLAEESVLLPKGTEEYNVYSNLTVFVNGIDMTLSDNPDWASASTCYVETLSDPVDFSAAGEQTVQIAVYVDGVNAEPVLISYTVRVQSDLTVTAHDATIFSGTNLQVKDLFVISDGGEEIPVTYDMLTGKADINTPGTYTLTLQYRGVSCQANVVVLDGGLLGTYKTLLTTFDPSASSSSYDDEDGEEVTAAPVYPLADLVITKDSVTVNGMAATITGAIDERTLLLRVSTTDFVLYYENGIAVLDPDNSIKLQYNDVKRPLIYFNEDVWTLNERVVVNYSSTYYVLEAGKMLGYSIDAFSLTSVETEQSAWYGLKVHLVETTSADTVYTVSWGEVVFADDFIREADAVSSLQFNGETYPFTMQTEDTAHINKVESDGRYAGLTFRGTVDGQAAELVVTSAEGYQLYVGGEQLFSVSSYELNNMKNGGANYADATVFLYSYTDAVFSYKFALDLEEETFTLLPRDKSYGLYSANGMFLYFDGYGTGLINFDARYYSTTLFTYTLIGNELAIRYQNTTPTFAYGKTATFYLGTLLNTLTVKDFTGLDLSGVTFVNSIVTDGAIVNVSVYRFAKNTNAAAGKESVYSAVEIVTKDGTVTNEDKSKYIDLSVVSFPTPGFYRMTITVEVGGEQVKCYYAIQILDDVYAQSPFAAAYGSGVLYSGNSLVLDAYGRAYLTCGSTVYTGSYKVGDDGTAVILASSASGKITATCRLIGEGILSVVCSGAAAFSDYFTTGTVRSAGTGGAVLREFTVNGQKTYILAVSTTSAGSIAAAEPLDGAGEIYKLTADGKTVYVNVLAWGNLTEGLEVLKNYVE